MRYYVESFYNLIPDDKGNILDYVEIGIANKEDEERDGANWCGRNDAFRFDIYDSLEDAIVKAGFIADKITFVDLPEEDMLLAKAIVSKLMQDQEYLKNFKRKQ